MTTRSLRRASNSSRGSSPPQPLILVLIDETRTEDYAVESIHDVLHQQVAFVLEVFAQKIVGSHGTPHTYRSEEHTSELQSRGHLVCRPLLEKKKRTDP